MNAADPSDHGRGLSVADVLRVMRGTAVIDLTTGEVVDTERCPECDFPLSLNGHCQCDEEAW